MVPECPFCGFQSSVYAVQRHIEQNHTNPPMHPVTSSPAAARAPRRKILALPAPGPDPEPASYPIKERRIVTRRYPIEEPSWIKCGVAGCGMYVARSNIDDHLDMHDAAAIQAEEEQRARRLGMMPSSRGAPGFPSSGGQYPSSRDLKKLDYGPMMDDDYDGNSTFSGTSGSHTSSTVSSAANGKHGKHRNHGSGSQAGKNGKEGDGSGSGRNRKNSDRKNQLRGWSRNSASGKGKDNSGKSVKSSSSSIISSSSKARSDGGGAGGGSSGQGSSGSKAGRRGSSGSGGGGSGGNGGNGPNAGNGGGGPGGGGPGNAGGNGPNGGNGPSRGNGNQTSGSASGMGDPMNALLGQGGPGGPDMGGLELQLAKLLLANRANPNAPSNMPGSGPNGVPNMAPNMGPPYPLGGSNPAMPSNNMSPNDMLQAIMKSVRPQSRDPNPYGMDQRIPSEAANLLAAIVASRSGGY